MQDSNSFSYTEEIPEWISPKYAAKIVDYETTNFYKTLKKRNPDGSLLIKYVVKDEPGLILQYKIWAPGLIEFMEADIERMTNEANYWLKKIKHQKNEILRLKKVFNYA